MPFRSGRAKPMLLKNAITCGRRTSEQSMGQVQVEGHLMTIRRIQPVSDELESGINCLRM